MMGMNAGQADPLAIDLLKTAQPKPSRLVSSPLSFGGEGLG
jgi:hypothetical protein